MRGLTLIKNFRRPYSNLKMPSKYVWIDLEMTGLQLETNDIMEVGCLVTTPDLTARDNGFDVIVHVDEERLQSMDSWCTQHHGQSGLTDACRNSRLSLQQAEQQLIAYIRQNIHANDTLFMAGNTIYMDRMFVNKYMPAVDKLLHYRMVDVSSIKVLCEGWYPAQARKQPVKKFAHRSLDDIADSIQELKYYRQSIFR